MHFLTLLSGVVNSFLDVNVSKTETFSDFKEENKTSMWKIKSLNLERQTPQPAWFIMRMALRFDSCLLLSTKTEPVIKRTHLLRRTVSKSVLLVVCQSSNLSRLKDRTCLNDSKSSSWSEPNWLKIVSSKETICIIKHDVITNNNSDDNNEFSFLPSGQRCLLLPKKTQYCCKRLTIFSPVDSRTHQIFQDILLYCGVLFHLLFCVYPSFCLGDCFMPFVFCNIPPEPCSCSIGRISSDTSDCRVSTRPSEIKLYFQVSVHGICQKVEGKKTTPPALKKKTKQPQQQRSGHSIILDCFTQTSCSWAALQPP